MLSEKQTERKWTKCFFFLKDTREAFLAQRPENRISLTIFVAYIFPLRFA